MFVYVSFNWLPGNLKKNTFSSRLRSKADIYFFQSTHQGTAAEEDHEDDEGLKVVVLHDGETGPAEVPPFFPIPLRDVHIQKWEATHTVYREGRETIN